MEKEGKRKTRRENGAGQMFARGGFWVIRWTEAGRVKQKTTKCRADTKAGRADAEAILAEKTKLTRLKDRRDRLAIMMAEFRDVSAEIERLEGIAATVAGMTGARLRQLVELFRESPRRRDCSEEMLARYETYLAAFVAWAGDSVRIADIDDAWAERYAAELAKKWSGGTYNKHINALEAAWRAVGRAAGAQGNPWEGLPRKRTEGHCRRALEAGEIEKVLEVAEGEVRALILVGLRTGLRMGDAVRLKWEAFRPSGEVEVVTGKTGAEVCLPGARLKDELLRLSPRAQSGYIMPGLAARYKRDAAGVSDAVTATFERAGLKVREKQAGWSKARPTASFHSLRHTFVTRAIEAGVPVAMVRALVGHTSETMTEHYTHVGAAAVLEAFSKAGV